jgi:predicted GNAT family acetyltransferase
MDSESLEVRHEDAGGRGVFFIEREGQRIAELAYSRAAERRIIIYHTEVEPELRSRGVARRLLDAAVAWARQTGTMVGATCSYAKAEFERDPSIRDVLAD